MSRMQKLVSAAIAIVAIFAVLSLAAPANLAAPPADGCKRSCPPVKKHNGYPCQFVGCDPVTGACLYGC